MGWSAPRTWVAGEVVTAALLNTHLRDDLRYLKGMDGAPTIETGLVIDNSGGDEYLKLPSLTTAERNALSPAEGWKVWNETKKVEETYTGAAWVEQVAPVITGAQGSIPYRGASVPEWLGVGTSGHFLKTQGAAANPVWAAPDASIRSIWAQVHEQNSNLTNNDGDYGTAQMNDGIDLTAYFSVPIPGDFNSLTKAVVVIIPKGTGNLYWAAHTDYAADGQANTTHSETIALATLAVTNNQMKDIDIRGALSSIAADDRVGVAFQRDGTDANDTVGGEVHVLGLLLEYTT